MPQREFHTLRQAADLVQIITTIFVIMTHWAAQNRRPLFLVPIMEERSAPGQLFFRDDGGKIFVAAKNPIPRRLEDSPAGLAVSQKPQGEFSSPGVMQVTSAHRSKRR